MISHLTFDTLKYANTLKKSGINSDHAEAFTAATADMLETTIQDQVVSKESLKIELNKLEIKLSKYFLKLIAGAVTIICTLESLLRILQP